MLILQKRHATQNRHPSQNHLRRLANRHLVTDTACSCVSIDCANMFAKADREHLLETASKVAVKIRMRLDAVDDDNAICLQCRRAEDNRVSRRSPADLFNLHARLKRDSHRGRCNTVLRQNPLLPIGSRSPMTSHRRQKKRLRTGVLQNAEHSLNDLRKIRNSTAADSHRNPHPRRNLRSHTGLCKLFLQMARKFKSRRWRIGLPQLQHPWKTIIHGGNHIANLVDSLSRSGSGSPLLSERRRGKISAVSIEGVILSEAAQSKDMLFVRRARTSSYSRKATLSSRFCAANRSHLDGLLCCHPCPSDQHTRGDTLQSPDRSHPRSAAQTCDRYIRRIHREATLDHSSPQWDPKRH